MLHIDPAAYYGSLWASFQLDQFLDWSKSHGSAASAAPGANLRPDDIPVTSSSASAGFQALGGTLGKNAFQDSTEEQIASEHSDATADDQHPTVPGHHKAAEDGSEHAAAACASTAERQPSMQVPVGGVGGIYTHAEVHRANGAELGPSREYNIDLAPRVSSISFLLLCQLCAAATPVKEQ